MAGKKGKEKRGSENRPGRGRRAGEWSNGEGIEGVCGRRGKGSEGVGGLMGSRGSLLVVQCPSKTPCSLFNSPKNCKIQSSPVR